MNEHIELYNDKFDYMTGTDFEVYCADLLRKNGSIDVSVTSTSGDFGADIIATQNKIMGDLRDLRDSISGVNIDEELADIIKFQHGYNVAAKFISVQDELLDTLINRLGV